MKTKTIYMPHASSMTLMTFNNELISSKVTYLL